MALVETRHKGNAEEMQTNICSVKACKYSQIVQSGDASLALEQDPILATVSTSNSSSISGTQQVA